ncbi:uncharacterized protein LOC144470931 [Augochlora pura]
MATSDVLQFHYCIEDEDAQTATKDFAGILGNVYEHYKKLCIKYFKLKKYCENVGVDIPFEVCESKSDNSNVVLQTPPKNSTTCNLDNALGLNVTLLADDKIDQKQIVNEKLLRSPVLGKKYKSGKNSFIPGHSILDDTNEIGTSSLLRENITVLANSSDEDISTFVETKENQCSTILNNEDTVECTPLSKLPKKMRLCKLYNVETTLLKSGKKLKQSRLEFVSSEESKMTINEEKHKKLTTLIQPEFLTSTKNLQKFVKVSGSNDEEIIEDSPTKHKISKLKMRSLKVNKSNPLTYRDNNRRKINLFSDTKITSLHQCSRRHTSTSNELCSVNKLKSFNTSLNKSVKNNCEIMPPPSLIVHTERIANNVRTEEAEKISTERIVNIPKKETEKIDTSNKSQAQKRKLSKLIEETCNFNLQSSNETFYLPGEKLNEKTEEINVKHMVNDIVKEETEKIDTSNKSQAQERKLSRLVEGTCNSNFSSADETFYLPGEKLNKKTEEINVKHMVNNIVKEETEKIDTSNKSQAQERKLSRLVEGTCNSNFSSADETFYLPGERLREKSTSEVVYTKISDNNTSENVSHMSSDVPYEEGNIVNFKTRNKAERAKMAGTSCWQCIQYYEDLGLSELEIKSKQKECSHHRIIKEKPCTPKEFWNPLFADTYVSTIQPD